MINFTKENVHARHGIKLSEKEIWRGIWQKDLSKTTQTFLWMAIHDAYMIGDNWLRPGYAAEYQERSECQTCIQTETMDHILTKCTATGQSEIWTLVDALWAKKHNSPTMATIKPNLGNIFGSPAVLFRHENGKINSGKTRLYRILIVESAHLIWEIRCERVIQNEGKMTPTREVKNKWIEKINARLELDCRMTHPKYSQKAIPKELVTETWSGLLKNENNLPTDWVSKAGGLVGLT